MLVSISGSFDLSESGSTGLLLLRRFVWYCFWKLVSSLERLRDITLLYSVSISIGFRLSLRCEICVGWDCFVVIVAQKILSYGFDWAVKMRIRLPELETSICDAKYHVSLALSVIFRGSWGDVARRFTMIRWAQKLKISKSIKTGPDIACRPENFTGCQGQARTKPDKKSDQPSRHHRRLAGAAAGGGATTTKIAAAAHDAARIVRSSAPQASHGRPPSLATGRPLAVHRRTHASHNHLAMGGEQRRNDPASKRTAALDQPRNGLRKAARPEARPGARRIGHDARQACKLRPSLARQAHGQRASSARDGARRGAAACGGVGRSIYHQSGPRPEPRLLRQPALEALTNSARTDSPRRVCRKQLSGERSGGGGGDDRRRLMRGRGGGQQALGCEICVGWDFFVVIVAQKILKVWMMSVEDEWVTPVYLISLLGPVSHYERSYHGFIAGRGVDPAGCAPGGG
ncbi:hypothetical protein F511_25895 [Dorcoceras hygrometricum]|uniref:Uncharacterized protein n=1 Tax=Dorcoceras hygrometricum TaxID=472368 RepID=A0A2Z7AT49_9LAMI|nr:hypothetical protein F511_25895 [Dorcoceras hygrometricum]